MASIGRPDAREYATFYQDYVSLVPEADILPALERQGDEIRALTAGVPSERETFRYQPEKWSVREVVGHMGDAERVFGYRLFCISRGEQAALPGFDEKVYTAASRYHRCPLGDLARQFGLLREANFAVIREFDEAAWDRTGTANASRVSVRALVYILVGHARHHCEILRSRYEVEG
jgi:DinB superfamily